MTDILIEELNKLFANATECLDASKAIINEAQIEAASAEEYSVDDQVVTLQLILQYRLNSQDALAYLMRMYQHVLDALGVQPGQSASINMDRLRYALGADDLKQVLNILALLVDTLTKIVHRYQKQQVSFKEKLQETQKQNAISKAMQRLADKQNHFKHVLEKMDEHINELTHKPPAYLDLDYIAGLTGPILQFYNEMIDQLGLVKDFFDLTNKHQPVHHHLNVLLNQAHEALSHMPSTYKPHPHFTLSHFEHKESSKDLEQTATAKRLRPFF